MVFRIVKLSELPRQTGEDGIVISPWSGQQEYDILWQLAFTAENT